MTITIAGGDLNAFTRARLREDRAFWEALEKPARLHTWAPPDGTPYQGAHRAAFQRIYSLQERLREVDTKLLILDLHEHEQCDGCPGDYDFGCGNCAFDRDEGVGPFGWCQTARLMGWLYRSHTEYKANLRRWAPQ